MQRIIVCGLGLAGVRAAEAVREQGFTGELVLVGSEGYFPPVDRPPLSKQILVGAWTADQARLRVAGDLDATIFTDATAVGLDVDAHTLELEDKRALSFDGLVIATGAQPRPLPAAGDASKDAMMLRSHADAERIRRALRPDAHAIIVGAGLIGAEVAASCRRLDVKTTVVDILPAPMVRALGPTLGGVVADLHRAHGVDLQLNTALLAADHVTRDEIRVRTDKGEISGSVLISAIGVVPDAAFLAHSALTIDNGIVCDQYGFAVGAHGIVAAGDVASWQASGTGAADRREHWTAAAHRGGLAGRNLAKHLAGEYDFETDESLPYFWSEQYDWRLQYLGGASDDTEIVEGTVESGRFAAVAWNDGRRVGALCVNLARRLSHYRSLLTDSAAGVTA